MISKTLSLHVLAVSAAVSFGIGCGKPKPVFVTDRQLTTSHPGGLPRVKKGDASSQQPVSPDFEPLRDALGKEDWQETRALVAGRFADSGPMAVRELIEISKKGSDPNARASILGIVAENISGHDSLVFLDSAMADNDELMLAMIQQALIYRADQGVLQEIADRFDSADSEKTRDFLVGTLEKVRNPEALEGLNSIASSISSETAAEDPLAWAAVRALVQIGNSPATTCLAVLMDRQEDLGTARAIAVAISMINSPEAIPGLAAVSAGRLDVTALDTRLAAVSALSSFRQNEAPTALRVLLTDPTAEIREAAKAALADRPSR